MKIDARTFWCLVLIGVLPALANGATYYVGKVATGDESGSNRDNVMLLATFQDTVSQPGDTALLQLTADHTSYGNWTINPRDGTNAGTAGHWITYQADPGTVTPRSADWLTRKGKLETPDPNIHVVFDTISWGMNYIGEPNSNETGEFWIKLDGLWTDKYMFFNAYVAKVLVQNSNVFAVVTDWAWSSEPQCVFFRHYYGNGSDMYDITFKNCYLWGGGRTVQLDAQVVHGPITFSACRMTNCTGSFIAPGNAFRTNEGRLRILDCRIDDYYQIGNNTSVSYYTVRNIVAVDGNEPRRIIQLDGDIAAGQADIGDFKHDGVGDLGVNGEGLSPMRLGGAIDHGTYWVTLPSDLPWDVNLAGDQMRGMDDAHGSGIAIRSDHIDIQRCSFHNLGDTRPLYVYDAVCEDVNITDCLFYSSLNIYGLDFAALMGNNLHFTNNTIIGRADPAIRAQDTYYLYGHALALRPAATADSNTWDVSNNLIVGEWTGTTLGNATRRNNIVYTRLTSATGSYATNRLDDLREDDVDPNNANNVIIYDGETAGNEPRPFHAAGGTFIGSDPNYDSLFSLPWNYDHMDADLHIKASGMAWNTGDPNHTTPLDFDKQTRTGLPDIGCDEIASTIKKLWGFKKL